jgi:S-formylglutathione hydrolase
MNRFASHFIIMVLGLLAAATATAQVTGTLERISVFGPSLAGNLLKQPDAPEVSVYLPPGYTANPDQRYPVVYVLHGYNGSDDSWFGNDSRMKANLTADQVMRNGTSAEMILVMPNCNNLFNGCMYVNSAATGYWEDYIADDLVSYIDSHYRTIPDRRARGLAGHSMGGYGVMLIGMRRPDVFSALYAMSSCCLNEYAPTGGERALAMEKIKTMADIDRGALRTFAVTAAWSPNPDKPPFYFNLPTLNGEVVPEYAARFAANSPQAILPSHVGSLLKMTAITMEVGEQDGLITANRTLSDTMNRYGIEHDFLTYEGDHGNRIAERFGTHALPFFSEHLRRQWIDIQ